jgi:hypothetical protein
LTYSIHFTSSHSPPKSSDVLFRSSRATVPQGSLFPVVLRFVAISRLISAGIPHAPASATPAGDRHRVVIRASPSAPAAPETVPPIDRAGGGRPADAASVFRLRRQCRRAQRGITGIVKKGEVLVSPTQSKQKTKKRREEEGRKGRREGGKKRKERTWQPTSAPPRASQSCWGR